MGKGKGSPGEGESSQQSDEKQEAAHIPYKSQPKLSILPHPHLLTINWGGGGTMTPLAQTSS